MPTCYVLAGLPGTGKSTMVKFVIASGMVGSDYFLYSTDRYIEEYANSVGKSYDEVFTDTIHEAKDEMDKQMAVAFVERKPIIWDQTNLSVNKRNSIADKMGVLRLSNSILNNKNVPSYRFECHYIMPPTTEEEIAEWRRRLESREGKTIPKNILESMISSYALPSFDENQFKRIVAYDMYGTVLSDTETDK